MRRRSIRGIFFPASIGKEKGYTYIQKARVKGMVMRQDCVAWFRGY